MKTAMLGVFGTILLGLSVASVADDSMMNHDRMTTAVARVVRTDFLI